MKIEGHEHEPLGKALYSEFLEALNMLYRFGLRLLGKVLVAALFGLHLLFLYWYLTITSPYLYKEFGLAMILPSALFFAYLYLTGLYYVLMSIGTRSRNIFSCTDFDGPANPIAEPIVSAELKKLRSHTKRSIKELEKVWDRHCSKCEGNPIKPARYHHCKVCNV